MCRIYKSGNHAYVRLCYYHGARRGERIPVAEVDKDVLHKLMIGKIYHFPKKKAEKKLGGSSKSRGRKNVDCPRCKKCETFLSRANYEIGICYNCQDKLERGG